jgi:hypothetical protein
MKARSRSIFISSSFSQCSSARHPAARPKGNGMLPQAV